jgi:hypothetical protein
LEVNRFITVRKIVPQQDRVDEQAIDLPPTGFGTEVGTFPHKHQDDEVLENPD